ncbi:DUF134 domain-containing protein [bacterium]|nr:DUF134 domain-containing protein [bacterium]
MPRPKKNRTVEQPPVFTTFKPLGIPARHLKEINLSLDEYEAIRLADLIGYDHETASKQMKISRSTFTRLVERARAVVAEFLVIGGSLVINGGVVHFKTNRIFCKSCKKAATTPLDEKLTKCPHCDSEDITDLAELMGHGQCCIIDEDNH